MYIQDNGKTRKLIADEGMKITNSDRGFFTDFIYLGKNDSQDNYEEVPRAIWKHFVEEENSDIIEARVQEVKNNQILLEDYLLETDFRLTILEIKQDL